MPSDEAEGATRYVVLPNPVRPVIRSGSPAGTQAGPLGQDDHVDHAEACGFSLGLNDQYSLLDNDYFTASTQCHVLRYAISCATIGGHLLGPARLLTVCTAAGRN